jgi:hypothetical protein
LVFGASATMAQEATPSATLQVTGQVAHPGHIHAGDCANLGDVVFPLSDAGVPATGNQDMGATPMAAAGGAAAGSEMAIQPTSASRSSTPRSRTSWRRRTRSTSTRAPITSRTTSPAARSAASATATTSSFGLRELNGSGYTGVGLISSDADGGVNVLVYLSPTGR